jgi:SAM-dependent methyltransferase
MRCYLCHGEKVSQVHGRCRDSATTKVLRCDSCGLVFLDNIGQVSEDFYEKSGMYEFELVDRPKLIADEQPDTMRRVSLLKDAVRGRRYLDFGCGTGTVAMGLKPFASEVFGVELNQAHRAAIQADFGIKVERSLDQLDGEFDIVSLFHVLEHFPDPIKELSLIHARVSEGGMVIAEVPHANEALVSLYESAAFKDFTYWSLHLFLFTEATLREVFQRSGFATIEVSFDQRFNLANHLYWLAKGRPGGHIHWSNLSTPELDEKYAKSLAEKKLSDTLIVRAWK